MTGSCRSRLIWMLSCSHGEVNLVEPRTSTDVAMMAQLGSSRPRSWVETRQAASMRSSNRALSFLCSLALALLAPLALIIVLGTSSLCEAAAEPKRIMILHSFGARFKPWSEIAQNVRSELARQSQNAVDFHEHSLVSARGNTEKSEVPFVDYLHALYAEHPLDLIVAIGAPAANFVQRHRPRLFQRRQ